MTRPAILVTGAGGKTGSAVTAELRERGWPVRAVVRRRDARSERLERLGAEVVVADLFDYEQTLAAARGTERAYVCLPFHPHMLQSAAVVAAAARDANLESVVVLGQWLASPSHPSAATRAHWFADRILTTIPGVSATIVRPGFFAEYPYMRLVRYAALLGVVPLPAAGTSADAPPSSADIARVAVAALLDPAAHAGRSYRPTGPRLLTVDEMTQIIGRAVGRRVRHLRLPLWMFLRAARLDGTPVHELDGLRSYFADLEAGAFAFAAPTTDVLDVTGRQPETFDVLARRYAAMPAAERTVANTARAVAEFLSVPLRPGFAAARYAREHEFPLPPVPRFAMQSEPWLIAHDVRPVDADAPLRLPVEV